MKVRPLFFPSLYGLLMGGMALLAAGAPGRAQGVVTVNASVDESDAEASEKKEPLPTFDSETEKDFADLMAKSTDARRKTWIEKMSKIIDKLTKATGLDDTGRKKLEASSHDIVETCLVDWKVGWERKTRTQMKQYPAADSARVLTALKSSVDTVIDGSVWGGENTVAPQNHSAWAGALKGALTPEQFAAWEKIVAEERQKLKEELGGHLDAWLAPGRESMEQALLEKTGEMSRTLNLPKERADQFKSLVKEAVDASMAKWRAREEQWLADMDDEHRRQTLKSRSEMYLAPTPNEAPEKMAVWKAGLSKLLSAEERKRLKDEAADHAAKSGHALARIMVAEIDARVALTGKQREQIEPICDRLAAKNLGVFSPPSSGGGYQRVDVIEMLASFLKSPESEMEAILDPIQWRHWLDASKISAQDSRGYSVSNSSKEEEQKPTLPAEPEEYERIVANYMDEKADRVRQKACAESLLRAEDAARASSLPADKAEQLKTAARGAVEESMLNWKSNVEGMVRANVGEAPVRFLQARLESLDRYNFVQRLSPAPETQAIWTDALKATLDTQQAAAVAKSVSEREAFRNESIAAFVVAMFDQSHHLTAAQQTALTTAVAGTIKEYQSDFQSYFSGGNSMEWFFSSYSMFLPVAAVKETELKSILGPECFDLWSRSSGCANAMMYWTNIKENHDARVKAAKK